MPRTTTSTTLVPAVLAITVGILLGGLAAARLAPTRPAVVAAVDLEKVFNSTNLHANSEARLKTLSDQFDAKLKELEAAMKDLQSELDVFQPGSPQALDLESRVQAAIGEYKAYDQYARLKIESEKAKTMRSTYEEIKKAAAELAQANSVDMVFIDDSIPDIDPSNSQQTIRQISARRLLYSNNDFDMSDELVTFLNKRFPLDAGVSPVSSPATSPAAGGAVAVPNAGG
jgi:Skp family chaperone for outer membrane proteins